MRDEPARTIEVDYAALAPRWRPWEPWAGARIAIRSAADAVLRDGRELLSLDAEDRSDR